MYFYRGIHDNFFIFQVYCFFHNIDSPYDNGNDGKGKKQPVSDKFQEGQAEHIKSDIFVKNGVGYSKGSSIKIN